MQEIQKMRRSGWRVSMRDIRIARARVAGRKEAYADTLARVVFDDIARGFTGGTYYMDGRPVDVNDPNLYSVGGAYKAVVLRDDEINSEGDVKAAVELLREAISYLESTSDAKVRLGFWQEDNGDWWFDASNIVEGFDEAIGLAKFRGEIAIYSFAEDTSYVVADYARRAMSKAERSRQGKGYAKFMAQRKKHMGSDYRYIDMSEVRGRLEESPYRKMVSRRKKDASKPVYRLDAVMEFDLYIDESKAAGIIQERNGVELPYSMQDIAHYEIFIGAVCDAIRESGFVIAKEYQSSRSYSYYVEFETDDAVVQVQFRISDHLRSGRADFYGSGNRRFKDFILGPNAYQDQIAVKKAARAACEAAKHCDWALFDRIV